MPTRRDRPHPVATASTARHAACDILRGGLGARPAHLLSRQGSSPTGSPPPRLAPPRMDSVGQAPHGHTGSCMAAAQRPGDLPRPAGGSSAHPRRLSGTEQQRAVAVLENGVELFERAPEALPSARRDRSSDRLHSNLGDSGRQSGTGRRDADTVRASTKEAETEHAVGLDLPHAQLQRVSTEWAGGSAQRTRDTFQREPNNAAIRSASAAR